ncbi:Rhodanese-like protein [Delitschia confertaspora ATCC 74209]|uniref:M-phase inducer phosphatase n=1 Tax=Delitschia confertaspora ATCC 74209 TaxID=1513339 RepID=A0A9P4JXC9_9PLEO|nr:Rhodanese-like protein [Delitschia confertaspora ATCC 74209]
MDSSPLVTMRPPPMQPAPWGYRRDLPPSKPLFAQTLGSKSFNFRDMSMKNSDYFTLQPLRGSSPTASLAADMSSNLHVDQSPQLTTPRRSLFTSGVFQQLDNRGTTTPPIRWEGGTTPPIPSSSPNFGPDAMDMSPLPHKAPLRFGTHLTLPSPTPEATPESEEMLSPCELAPTNNLDIPRPVSAAERRKPSLLRPCLARTKNYSTNTVSFKAKENIPIPTFKFGAGCDGLSHVPSPSLDECFTASPPQDRKSNPLLGPLKPKPFCINTNLSRANGSPLSANIRKPVGPSSRRPSKFRRSLSMFEHPGDVMNQEQEKDSYTPSGLQSVMDVDDTPSLKLPHFLPTEPDALPRITDSTLINVLNGDYNHLYDKTVIIDCRFEYEYEGGHIEGAQNFCDKEQLAGELFTPSSPPNTLLIFHCEYSAHRAPLMAKFVRNEDRRVNAFRYPHLTYPEVYILDGGYSAFFESHRTRCFPQNYLKMDAKEHENACERGMNKLRQRSKLNRAQTFAFGQQSCQMEDSPTAMSRSKTAGPSTLGGDDIFNVGRIGTTRRMASY